MKLNELRHLANRIMRAGWLACICCIASGSGPVLAAGPEPGTASQPTGQYSLHVTVNNGLVTVLAEAAPLSAVLAAYSEASGVRIRWLGERIDAPVTTQYQDVTLEDGLRRLLNDHSYVLKRSELAGEGALTKVLLLNVGSDVNSQSSLTSDRAPVTLTRAIDPTIAVKEALADLIDGLQGAPFTDHATSFGSHDFEPMVLAETTDVTLSKLVEGLPQKLQDQLLEAQIQERR